MSRKMRGGDNRTERQIKGAKHKERARDADCEAFKER